MSEDFNLHALIREVLDTSDAADPAMLAKEVNRRIKKADRDAALEVALDAMLHQVVARRRSAPDATPGGQQSDETQAGTAAGGRSTKVAAIRGYARMLRDRVSVGSEPGEWKFLGDCTAENLAYAAALREAHARQTWARAGTYRRLAELLEEHDVATVRELPTEVLNDLPTSEDDAA